MQSCILGPLYTFAPRGQNRLQLFEQSVDLPSETFHRIVPKSTEDRKFQKAA